MGKFMIIFPRQITAEQMGFSFEFFLARIIFALGRTFQNLEKNPKNLPPKHTDCGKCLYIIYTNIFPQWYFVYRYLQH